MALNRVPKGAVKETNTDQDNDETEKIFITFRTYNQYGQLDLKNIDITDLVRNQVGDNLKAAANTFVGLKYEKDQSCETVGAYHLEAGRELKSLVDNTTEMAVVNANQLGAINRHIEQIFDEFDRRIFGKLW